MKRIVVTFAIVAALALANALGALVQRWLLDRRDGISFVDCDGARQTVTKDERFTIIIGDEGCMRLMRTPDSLRLTCTVDRISK